MLKVQQQQRTSVQKLQGATQALNFDEYDDDEMFLMMSQAKECAESESCSIDEAESFLQTVIEVQEGCNAALSGRDICIDVTFPSEVVALLRKKIEDGAREPKNALAIQSMASPMFLSMFAIYLISSVITMTASQQQMQDPFTVQEVFWAIRDGYFGELVSQFLKNGGLAPLEVFSDATTFNAQSAAILPFTMQEWMWSVRDGYLADMISTSVNTGGLEQMPVDLRMDVNTEPIATAFMPEEWAKAASDGYLGTMISHYMRNGGL